jgi:AcrR family transcriptional regulator
VGLRQQSLTYYFPTKQDLLDALFADGFTDLRHCFDKPRPRRDTTEAVVNVAVAYVDYCIAHPARYHLMFQRAVPGFEPSEQSHRVALHVLGVLIERLAAAGITDAADIAVVRSLMGGQAAEQIADDPHGRGFADRPGARSAAWSPRSFSRAKGSADPGQVSVPAARPPCDSLPRGAHCPAEH